MMPNAVCLRCTILGAMYLSVFAFPTTLYSQDAWTQPGSRNTMGTHEIFVKSLNLTCILQPCPTVISGFLLLCVEIIFDYISATGFAIEASGCFVFDSHTRCECVSNPVCHWGIAQCCECSRANHSFTVQWSRAVETCSGKLRLLLIFLSPTCWVWGL